MNFVEIFCRFEKIKIFNRTYSKNIERLSISKQSDYIAPSLDDALKFIDKNENDG